MKLLSENKVDFRADADVRINNHRCAGIIVKERELLLMHRIKNGDEYFVLPGGHLRRGETFKQCAIREIKEETNIELKNLTLVFEFIDHRKNFKKNIPGKTSFSKYYDHYFFGQWKSGQPLIVGEEKDRNSHGNFFEPKWVNIIEAKNLNILPLFAKEWIEKNL